MDYQKITNLLGTMPDEAPRFITKKWIEVQWSDNAQDRYKPSRQIRFKTSMLRSNLCDFSGAYIAVKEKITVTGTNNRSRKNKPLAFKKMHHLLVTFQKLIIRSLIMQEI